MIRVCFGWFEPKHDPLTLGYKEPLDDPRITHGICPDCEDMMLSSEAEELK
jgi:hypothetical protein